MQIRRTSGFTIIEMVIVVAIIAVLTGAGGFAAYTSLRDRAETARLSDAVRQFNTSAQSFVAAKGLFTPSDDPLLVLRKLQTPADAMSRKAGFGNFEMVDYRLTLVSLPASEAGSRLTMVYDAAQQRPVWSVATSGDGYRLILNNSATEPYPADWTSYVDTKAATSQTGARHSSWVWDFNDVASTRPDAGPSVTVPGLPNGGGTVGADLNITGPTTITVPGTYYWSGTSSQRGQLTITANGVATSLNAATAVQSVTQSYVASDSPINATYLVTLTRTEGGTVSKNVTVAIAAKPTVTLTGPDTVTTTDPQTWQADSSVPADPLSLRIPTVPEHTGTTTVSSTHPGWPEGTQTTIIVTASALNESGFDAKRKTVVVNIPPPLGIEWVDLDLNGQPIAARGNWHYEARGTNIVGPSTLSADILPNLTTYLPNTSSPGSWITSSSNPIGATSPSSSTSPLSVTLETSSLDSTAWLIGSVTLAGTLSSPVQHTAKSNLTVPVSIAPTKFAAAWDLEVVGARAGTIASIGLRVVGSGGASQATPTDSSGAATTRLSASLPEGTYTITGTATFNDGTSQVFSSPLTVSIGP